MGEDFRSILTGTAGLGIAAVAAAALTLTRDVDRADFTARLRVAQSGGIATLIQIAHFIEEWYGAFHEHFPLLLGLTPWPALFFVTFNFVWIVAWGASVAITQRHASPAALFPLWFLGISATLNGVAHPLLAVARGGYFPGLWTSPFVGIAGVLLLRALLTFTRSRASREAAA
jgi:hypothetical protein